MATPADFYVNGIKKKLNNYFATWLPSQEFKLGDVGVLEGNFFTRINSLNNLGIAFEERADSGSTPINYVSDSGVTITIKTSGEINQQLPSIPEAKAGMGIEFSKEGAFIVQAAKSYEPSISNISKLEEDIRHAFQDGKWKSKWVVITQLVYTPSATILISNSSRSKIELSAEGTIPVNGFSLGEANAGFSMTSQTGDIWQCINAKNLTPFFKLVQIQAKPSLWDILKIGTAYSSDLWKSATAHSKGVNPLDVVTPSVAKTNTEVAKALYLEQLS